MLHPAPLTGLQAETAVQADLSSRPAIDRSDSGRPRRRGPLFPPPPWPSPSIGTPPGAQARAGQVAANARSSSLMNASIGRSSGSKGRSIVAAVRGGLAYAGAP